MKIFQKANIFFPIIALLCSFFPCVLLFAEDHFPEVTNGEVIMLHKAAEAGGGSVFILVGDNHLQDGLYFRSLNPFVPDGVNQDHGLYLLSRGTFVPLSKESRIKEHFSATRVNGSNNRDIHSESEFVIWHEHLFFVQLVTRVHSDGSELELFQVRFSHPESPRLAHILQSTPIVKPVFNSSYQMGAFLDVPNHHAMLISLSRLRDARIDHSFTGALYLFPGEMGNVDPFMIDPILEGRFVTRDRLKQLLITLESGHVVLQHPDCESDGVQMNLILFGPRQREATTDQEHGEFKYYDLTRRVGSIQFLHPKMGAWDTVTLSREDVLKKLSPESRVPIFEIMDRKIRSFATARNSKVLVFSASDVRTRELIVQRLHYLIYQSDIFSGRYINLDSITRPMHELFDKIDLHSESGAIAVVATQNPMRWLSQESMVGVGADFIRSYSSRFDGPKLLRFIVVADTDEVTRLSTMRAPIPLSAIDIVKIGVSHDDVVLLARHYWNEFPVLASIEISDQDLNRLILKAGELDDIMPPIDRTRELISFIADSVTVDSHARTLTYTDLEMLEFVRESPL